MGALKIKMLRPETVLQLAQLCYNTCDCKFLEGSDKFACEHVLLMSVRVCVSEILVNPILKASYTPTRSRVHTSSAVVSRDRRKRPECAEVVGRSE